MRNFHHPYLARTIADFWRRWHISLSTWFKDYLYIPLGGNRVSPARWTRNIMMVFLTSGLWHGAAWTFVIWGGLHGLYQVAGRFTAPARARLRQALHIGENSPFRTVFSTFITFCLVAFAWGFFRVNSFADVKIVFSQMLQGWDFVSIWRLIHGFGKQEFILSCALILLLYTMDCLSERMDLWAMLKQCYLPVRWIVYYAVLLTIILFGVYGQTNTFIYFQF